MIACHSVIGYGAAKEGTSKVHGSPIGAEDLLAARKRLGFEYAPFEVPQDILNEWRSFGKKDRPTAKLGKNALPVWTPRKSRI